ncbi:MAG: formylglycine-generating enzyme family protein [Anaerolineales bacterium]|nr:formylglycine-generating enzyme family protein [Anaerolineales bacterium]
MKKRYPVLFAALVIALAACSTGGGDSDAEPTSMVFPTAAPTATAFTVNPTAETSGDSTAGEERLSPVDGMTQVYIPAGSFRMGGLDSLGTPDEEPDRQVTISHGFWMDKVEVTNGMYMLCVQAGACEPPRSFASASRDQYFNTDEFNNFPVIAVTWDYARAYCEWAGRRLPTEAEWEYAARGTDFRIFPWGDDRPDASRANFRWLVRDTTPVGSYPAGASPWGILDLSGNVWEWVEDYYVQTFYAMAGSTDPIGPSAAGSNDERRVIRGGSWQDGEEEIRVSNRGFALAPDHDANLGSDALYGEANNKTGFRCVSNN